jgi:hypothetical protein
VRHFRGGLYLGRQRARLSQQDDPHHRAIHAGRSNDVVAPEITSGLQASLNQR